MTDKLDIAETRLLALAASDIRDNGWGYSVAYALEQALDELEVARKRITELERELELERYHARR